MAMAGAELLVYPTAIGYDPNDTQDEQSRQREAWMTIQRGHAIANGIPVLSVNRVGFEPDPSGVGAGAHFWGNSLAAGCQGELLAVADTEREQVLVVDLDRQRSEKIRRIWPYLRDRRIDA
jgi:N-carbamoylputrescine amidase